MTKEDPIVKALQQYTTYVINHPKNPVLVEPTN